MKCWFCSVRDSNKKDAHEFDMYGEVNAKDADSKTNVAYSVRHLALPRCHDCHSKHRIAKTANVFSVILLMVLIGGVLSKAFGWVSPLIAGIWIGLAAGLILASLLTAAFIQKGINTVRSGRAKYPEVVDLKKECYRFGSRPRKPVAKGDPPCDNNDKQFSGQTDEDVKNKSANKRSE